jgi:hypothetical protein
MKILSTNIHGALLDDGSIKTYNEVVWNYRSACCGSALKRVGDSLSCKYCAQENPDIVHKNQMARQADDVKAGIEALPENVREAAVGGYYIALERDWDEEASRNRLFASRTIHISGGEGTPFELPENLRRKR